MFTLWQLVLHTMIVSSDSEAFYGVLFSSLKKSTWEVGMVLTGALEICDSWAVGGSGTILAHVYKQYTIMYINIDSSSLFP